MFRWIPKLIRAIRIMKLNLELGYQLFDFQA